MFSGSFENKLSETEKRMTEKSNFRKLMQSLEGYYNLMMVIRSNKCSNISGIIIFSLFDKIKM